MSHVANQRVASSHVDIIHNGGFLDLGGRKAGERWREKPSGVTARSELKNVFQSNWQVGGNAGASGCSTMFCVASDVSADVSVLEKWLTKLQVPLTHAMLFHFLRSADLLEFLAHLSDHIEHQVSALCP